MSSTKDIGPRNMPALRSFQGDSPGMLRKQTGNKAFVLVSLMEKIGTRIQSVESKAGFGTNPAVAP